MIIGWFFFIPSLGDVVAVASQGRFLFFYTSAWAMLSQMPRRGVFFVVFTSLSPKGSYLVKQVDFWTRFFEK